MLGSQETQKLHTTVTGMLTWVRARPIRTTSRLKTSVEKSTSKKWQPSSDRYDGDGMARNEEKDVGRLNSMQVQEKRRRGRSKKIWLDNIREDMEEYIMTDGMAQNQSVWHMKTNTGLLLHG